MKQTKLERLFREQLDKDYRVIKKLGSGGYGITFLARDRRDQRKVVIKLPNLDLDRHRSDLKERIEEFNRSLEAEYESMRRLMLEGVHSVAKVFGTGGCELNKSGSDPLPVRYLVQQYIPGQNFDSFLGSQSFRAHANVRPAPREKTKAVFSGIKNARMFLALAAGVVNALAEVHRHEVVHGDVWPENIRVGRDRKPVIVDFGQSLLVDLFFQGQQKRIDHKYAAPERREARGQWGTAADIYSLGGVLFFMATGQPPPDPIEDREELKKTVCREIKKNNPELYRANSGIADVIARCLRHYHGDRPSFAEGVLAELTLFLAPPDPPELNDAMASLRSAVKDLRRDPSDLFAHIAGARIRTLTRQVCEMSRGLYTLAGHSESITKGMVECLSLLRKGDSYLTVSIPSFWTRNPYGLGVNGRFLEINKITAQNGVSIGRVFLICEGEEHFASVREILEAHLRIMQELEEHQPHIPTRRWSDVSGRQGYYVGVRRLDEELRSKLEVTNFGIWTKARQNQDVLVVPQYREKEKDVAAIRFWAPVIAQERIRAYKDRALHLLENSIPLREFIESLDRKGPELRRYPRQRADERVPVQVVLKHKSGRGPITAEPLSARVLDYSRYGVCLKVLAPWQNSGLPAKGGTMRLVGPCSFASTVLSKFWRGDMKVRWTTETNNAPWKAGLTRT